MKRLIALIAAVAAVSVISASAQVGRATFGSGVTVTNATTNSTSWSTVKVDRQDVAGLYLKFGTPVNVTNLFVFLQRSPDGVNFETTPGVTVTFDNNGAAGTNQWFFTNLSATDLGSAHSLRARIGNTNTASITNVVLGVSLKRK
jgi:hypothetical protein